MSGMCPEYLQFFRHERCWLDCGFVASNTLRNLGNKNEQMRSPTCPVLIPGKLKSEAVKLLCAAPAELRWHNSNCISMNTKLNSSLYAGYCWMLSGRYRAPCTVSAPGLCTPATGHHHHHHRAPPVSNTAQSSGGRGEGQCCLVIM